MRKGDKGQAELKIISKVIGSVIGAIGFISIGLGYTKFGLVLAGIGGILITLSV